MGMSRKRALLRLNGLLPRVREHLTKLRERPGDRAVNHWRGEVRVWLRQMTDVLDAAGGNTAAEWRTVIAACYAEPGRRAMADRLTQAEALMARVFDELCDADPNSAEYARRRFDFAFHMCDWLGDLDALHAALSNPAAVDAEKFASDIYGILFHIIPHLRAAFRALEGREANDPFLEPTAATNGVHAGKS